MGAAGVVFVAGWDFFSQEAILRPLPVLAIYSRTLIDGEYAPGCLCSLVGLCVMGIPELRSPEIPTHCLEQRGTEVPEKHPRGAGLYPGWVRASPPGCTSHYLSSWDPPRWRALSCLRCSRDATEI